ncbi:uncharacterized protein LOC144096270 isoform X2 [Amblyomma americanum]
MLTIWSSAIKTTCSSRANSSEFGAASRQLPTEVSTTRPGISAAKTAHASSESCASETTCKKPWQSILRGVKSRKSTTQPLLAIPALVTTTESYG